MKKIEDESHENLERWLLTYADLITLLMIFFIVMYAISSINVQKFGQLAQSLGLALGGKNMIADGTGKIVGTVSHVFEPSTEEGKLEDLKGEIDKYLKKNGLENSVVTMIDEKGLSVRLKDSILFDSGKAEIKPKYRDKIVKIGQILSKTDSYIRVEGHTDNVPIYSREFKSNWQLSAIRATNVAELLIDQSGIKADKIAAVGYGEFRPIADNSTEEGKSKNRRVEIILINSKFNQIEENKK